MEKPKILKKVSIHSKAVSKKQLSNVKDNTNTNNVNDFKVLKEEEVVKVPNCTFFNDVKYTTTFYFCQCSKSEFYPVCIACAETCHKFHAPTLKLDGIFECQCGKCNHTITEEDDARFQEKKLQSNNTCIYTNFYNFTANKGFRERVSNSKSFHDDNPNIKVEEQDDLKSYNNEEIDKNKKTELRLNLSHSIENEDNDDDELEDRINLKGDLSNKNNMKIRICSTCAESCFSKDELVLDNDNKIYKDNKDNDNDFSNNNSIISNNDDYNNNKNIYNSENNTKQTNFNKAYYPKDFSNCQCPKHYEFNQVNGNLDLMGKFHILKEHLLNFNSNLIGKVGLIKEKYSDYIKNSINKIYESSNKKEHFNFSKKADEILFNEVYNSKTLELFDYFSTNQSIYFYMKSDIFEDVPIDFILRLISYESNTVKDSEKAEYALSRMLFANLVFDNFIKSPYISNNSRFSVHTILNMNLLQRFFFFQKSTEYHMINPYNDYINNYDSFIKSVKETNTEYNNNYISNIDLIKKIKDYSNSDQESKEKEDLFGNDITNKKNFSIKNKHKQFFPNKTFFGDYASSLIELYEFILRLNESCDIKNKIVQSIFPKLNLIFKFLIKYNLISNKESMRYFELVIDTIVLVQDDEKERNDDEEDKEKDNKHQGTTNNINNNKKYNEETNSKHKQNSSSLTYNTDNYSESNNNDQTIIEENADFKSTNDTKQEGLFNTEYSIIKSIFYFLIHRNDKICIDYILREKDKNNKDFVFISHKVSQVISKIFICMMLKFNRNKDLKKTLVYDFYVKKIMELLIGNNEFYLNNLRNMNSTEFEDINLIDNGKVSLKIKNSLKVDIFFNFYSLKTSEMSLINKEFRTYSINYYQWLICFNRFIDNLDQFIKSEISYEPSFLEKYQVLFEDQLLNEDVKKKILASQRVLKFTNLFDKINECLEIYSKGLEIFKGYVRHKDNINEAASLENNNNDNININIKNSHRIINNYSIACNVIIDDKENENENNKISEFILPDHQIMKLMKFLYLLTFKSNENLCLLMNFNCKNFTNVFMHHLQGDFFSFLDAEADIFFYGEFTDYKFDNMTFFHSVFNLLLDNIDFTEKLKEENEKTEIRNNTKTEKDLNSLNSNNFNSNNNKDSINIENKDDKNSVINIGSNDIKNINLSNYLKDPKQQEQTDIKNYLVNMNLMEKIIKVLNKGIQSASINNIELVSVVEHMLSKITEIKLNSFMIKLIEDTIRNDLENYNLPDESEYTLEEIKSIILDFISIYFFFINELISNDFLFFNVLNSDYHFIFNLEEVGKFLNESNRGNLFIPFKLESELIRFNVSLSLDRGFNFCSSDKQISNLYLCDVPSSISNLPTNNITTSLNYLALKDNNTYMGEELKEKASILIKIFRNFDVLFNRCFNYFNYSDNMNFNVNNINNNNTNTSNQASFSGSNIIEKKTAILRFYEFCVIRPTFLVFNSFLIETKQLQGESFFNLYDLVFNFMKVSFYLFKNLVKINIDNIGEIKDNNNSNNNNSNNSKNEINQFKKQINIQGKVRKTMKQKKLLLSIHELYNLNNNDNLNSNKNNSMLFNSLNTFNENILQKTNSKQSAFNINNILEQIYDFEELTVKAELNIRDLEEIRSDINIFSDDKIKYFELPVVQNVLLKHISKILKKPEDLYSQSKNKSFFKKSEYQTKILKKSVPKLIPRVEQLIEKYQDKVDSTFDENLAIISIFESSDSEVDVELSKEIFKYLMMKFCDSLTTSNFIEFSRNQRLIKEINDLNNDKKLTSNMKKTQLRQLNHRLQLQSKKNLIAINSGNSNTNNLLSKNITNNLNNQNNNMKIISQNTKLILQDPDHKKAESQATFNSFNKQKNNNNYNYNSNIGSIASNMNNINTNNLNNVNPINLKFIQKGQIKKYTPGNIEFFKIQDFKFQNAYIIKILNSLFLHASEIFQELLQDELNENAQTNFIMTVSQNLVFANLLIETKKNFELSHIFPQCSLAFELGTNSVKFLQNMCEAHNITFQNKLFDLKFNRVKETWANSDFYRDDIFNKNQQDYLNASGFNPRGMKKRTSVSVSNKNKLRKTVMNLSQPMNISSNNNIDNASLNKQQKELSSLRFGTVSIHNLNIKENIALKENKEIYRDQTQFPSNVSVSDYLEKQRKQEEEEKVKLQSRKFALINFYFNCMRVILTNSNIYQNSLLYKVKDFVTVENMLEFYQRFSDLIVEMIQGTSQSNFESIYRKLPDRLNVVNENGVIKYENEDTFDCFMFCKLILEIKGLLFNSSNIFCQLGRDAKFNLFFTINNIINQDVSDTSVVKMLTGLLPPDKVLDLVSDYLRGIYIKYIYKIDYNDEEFPEYFEFVEFVDKDFNYLLDKFKTESVLYEDQFFTLASQMFLYLTILGAKYEIPEAAKLLEYENKITIKSEHKIEKSSNKQSINQSSLFNSSQNENKNNMIRTDDKENDNSILGGAKDFMMKSLKPNDNNNSNNNNNNNDISYNNNNDLNNTLNNTVNNNQENKQTKKPKLFKRLNKHHINNLIISVKFFNKITKSVEFMIDSSNDDSDELKLKKIYFIIDPRVYLISKGAISNFLAEVDRSSSTTKLKALINNLNYFISEIDFKFKHIQKSKLLKWMLEVDYTYADKLNFLFAIKINLILLIFLENGYKNPAVYYVVCSIAILQMLMNLVYMSFFLISKWRFYVILEKSKCDSKNLSLRNLIDIYILNSFIFNDDVYIMILNILVGFVATWTYYTTFLFSLGLLTIVKFVPAVKEIVIAFQMRIGQLMSMIGFLFIVLFAYANIGFRFYRSEFKIILDDDKYTNICDSLLECTISYFNLGVRSGGGIGDLLSMKSYNQTYLFWIRYLTDMVFYITVILLLLNMVNGVIVSTFSQIREENNARDEDMNNKCFICSIDRLEFEKRKISFKEHNKKEHNIRTYIKYLVWLKLINEKDLDGDQSFIMQCIKQEEISCFPVLRSSTLGNLNDKNNEDDDEKNNED